MVMVKEKGQTKNGQFAPGNVIGTKMAHGFASHEP